MFTSIPDGSHKGKGLNRTKYNKMLDKYYELHGWNKKTGVPTNKTLKDLDLKTAIEDLE